MLNRILIALGLIAAAVPSWAAEATASAIYARSSPSIVTVIATGPNQSRKQGSGVIVETNKVLTNCHVVSEAKVIQVRFFDSQNAPAKLVGRYATLDLCVIEASTQNRKSVEVRSLASIKPGLRVVAIGNPLGLTASVSEGVVSGVRESDGFKMLQHSAPTSPGSSGGGLFDAESKLVGLTTSSNVSGQNINFAIPAEYIQLLAMSPAATQAIDKERATFKELPFGSSKGAVTQAFPDAKCEALDASTTICDGTTDYFNRKARYSIWISNRGSYMAYVRIFGQDMDDAFSEASDALVERFGLTYLMKPGSFAQWRIGSEENQSVTLMKCDGQNNCLGKASPGIMVIIFDDRFKPEKKKEF
jgi:S1-C subfamily serine protease